MYWHSVMCMPTSSTGEIAAAKRGSDGEAMKKGTRKTLLQTQPLKGPLESREGGAGGAATNSRRYRARGN